MSSPRLIHESPAMKRLLAAVEQVAKSQCSVLFTGESGTGKDTLARLLHERSERAAKPFASLNCAGFSEQMLDDELFGHVAHAFTGAVRGRKGILEDAHGGSVFLDELGDMPAAVQAKLLRVVEDRLVRRLGSNETCKVDLRYVAATNRDLNAMMERREFRTDLYWRLAVIELHIPPLRERTEDILPLVMECLERQRLLYGKRWTVDGDAQRALNAFHWPGNIRQLFNAVAGACALAPHSTLTPADFLCLKGNGVSV